MPKISIIIPTYNNLVGINRVIKSILSQKYEDYEVIVTDDSSHNDIELYLKELNNPKIKYFKNLIVLGSPENWNEGLRHATGEYIKIIHHDDWLSTDEALGKFVNLMDKNKHCDIGYSKSVNVDIDKNKKIHRHAEKYVKKIEKNPLLLINNNRIGAPSVCIFRNGQNLFFDKKLKWLVDIDFYITILKANPHIAFIKEELVNIGIQGYRMTDYCLENEEILKNEYLYVKEKFSK